MRIVEPAGGTRITVPSDATWPQLPIVTDADGPHRWEWAIAWHNFRRTGNATTSGNRFEAGGVVRDLGGDMTVTAVAGGHSARVALTIVGTNPAAHEVDAYLATRPDSAGFGAILRHETNYRHFRETGLPIRSFDSGFGIAQLTNPRPTYEQCWNWKRNIDAGLALFAEKVRLARRYLGASGRTFTAAQLEREAVARWNGGAYHRWNGQAWVRNPDILCDAATHNIGWDMTDPANTGQTAAQLHRRDADVYRRPPGDDAHWGYSGICYADAVLG